MTRISAKALTGALIVAAIAGGFYLLQEPPLSEPPASAESADLSHTDPIPSVVQDSATSFAQYQAFASHLDNQLSALPPEKVDYQLKATEQGDLVISPDVRNLFEHFHTRFSKEGLDIIKARLARHFAQSLPPSAALQAWTLLEQYLALRIELAELPPHDGTVGGMRRLIDQRQALAQNRLGMEAAEAFYGMEHRYDVYLLSRRAVQEDPSLSEDDRRQRLALLESSLSPSLKQAMAAQAAENEP